MATDFIRIHNKIIALDSIGYVDFLDSGRSMIFIPGMSTEKQHISVDEGETRRLREFFDARALPLSKGTAAPAPAESPAPDFSRRGEISRRF